MMSMFWKTASAVPAYHIVSETRWLAGQDVEALVPLRAEEVPTALQVADQAVGLVLRRHADAADAGVQRVRQRKIDDPGFAAEIDGGLGALVGQLHQPAAATAGKDIGHRVARKRPYVGFDASHLVPSGCRLLSRLAKARATRASMRFPRFRSSHKSSTPWRTKPIKKLGEPGSRTAPSIFQRVIS